MCVCVSIKWFFKNNYLQKILHSTNIIFKNLLQISSFQPWKFKHKGNKYTETKPLLNEITDFAKKKHFLRNLHIFYSNVTNKSSFFNYDLKSCTFVFIWYILNRKYLLSPFKNRHISIYQILTLYAGSIAVILITKLVLKCNCQFKNVSRSEMMKCTFFHS